MSNDSPLAKRTKKQQEEEMATRDARRLSKMDASEAAEDTRAQRDWENGGRERAAKAGRKSKNNFLGRNTGP